MFTPSNSYYYVSDYSYSKILILNESWSQVSSKQFGVTVTVNYLTTIGNSLYVTGRPNIWKLDQNLNILIQYNATGDPYYEGIYFNSTNNFIYIAPANLYAIHVFDLNLSLNHTFSTSSYRPWSIAGYNDQLYLGDISGSILVVVNEVIIRTFKGCNGNLVQLNYILFDQCGYLATSCDNNELYLYHSNGTYLSKNFNASTRTKYIGYDSKGNFIQISTAQISIYN
jgi:hypothetical protein